jgi:tetratricopeptide (TPR) repeat protein
MGHQSSSPGASDRVVRRRQQELELLLRQAPADSSAYLELAQIYREQDRHHDATQVLERALSHLPDEMELRWQLEEALMARALQRLKSASEVELMQPNEQNREDVERARINWANCRRNVCQSRLNRNPGQANLHVVLAEALKDLGEYEEAIRETDSVLSSPEDSPQAYLIRGQCFQALGRPLDALSAWRSAGLRRAVPAPEGIQVAALQAAANTALQQGLYASGKRYLQELRRLRPSDDLVAETLKKIDQLIEDDGVETVPPVELTP